MVPVDLRATLREALDPDPRPRPAEGDRLAAVLVPFVVRPEPTLIFTLRSDALSRHPGEIAFPGGLQDPGEALAATALREACEEIGLDPELPDLVGALRPVPTHVSRILVVPFVGVLGEAPALTMSHGEIAEVLSFPVGRLVRAERRVTYRRDPGRPWQGWAYEMDGATIWGATGSMLHELLDVLRKEAPWATTSAW